MIKVTRKAQDVTVEYFNDLDQREGRSSVFCKDIASAKELAATVRKAVKLGYGFAKCRALLEGDTL